MSSAHALVMGSASNLSADHFVPFFTSLRASGFEGHTCVFVARMDPDEQAMLGAVVDEVVEVDPRFPPEAPTWVVRSLAWTKHTRGLRKHFPTLCHQACRLTRARPGSKFADDLEFRLQGLQSLRYAQYESYVRDRPEFTQIMISDLRDVIFQRDPFAAPVDDLEVFLEEPEVNFAVEGFNRRWVQDLYGDAGVVQLGDRVVSCSGVTFGDRDGMLRYLAEMSREVRTHLPPLGPHDQAVHNWLLSTGALGSPHRVANGHGRVLTMGAQRDIELAADGTVVNHDGSVPAVLHQYDRHVDLAPSLLAAF